MNNIATVLDKRRAGILLHITSLPSTLGNGTMGRNAHRFIDFLNDCGLSVWQVLPIHPPQRVPLNTPYRDFLSPYQPQSVYAGNPLLIDLNDLMKKGWLPQMTLPFYNNQQLEQVIDYRYRCLKDAYSYFSEHASTADHDAYQQFIEENQDWLEDYALFCTLKDFYQGACWWNWPDQSYRYHEPQALEKARKRFADKIEQYCFMQFAFFTQWQELQEYAHQNGVYLFGDLPFFVARDSVEVWAHPENFLLNEQGNPQFLSGVPSKNDYFCPHKGQCWGNPLYNWDNNFQWWIARFKRLTHLFDLVRLTHFRGFCQCWAIPADNPNPAQGNLQSVPGEILFEQLQQEKLLDNSIVAEDIGAYDEVIKLRKNFGLLGMKILQLAFDLELKNHHLPHHHLPHNIIYTGTHDSNTTVGWFEKIKTKNEEREKYLCEYLNTQAENVPWAMIQAAFQSVAKLTIIPMQDILGLDAEHRMNTPGTSNGHNWRWQFEWLQITPDMKKKLKELVERYERN